jgi:DNA-binding transcriptional LysR family regulator
MNDASSSAEIGVLVAVAEAGSFAAAADNLGLTPSGVSKAVTRLEERLGVRLIERTTRRLLFTTEGDLMVARGRDILAAIEAAEAEVTAARGKPNGLVRVNTGTAFAKHRLAPILPAFHEAYPDIRLELAINDRRIDVLGEQVDIAVRTGFSEDSGLITRKIGEMRRVICATPAYLARHGAPLVPHDLLKHNCLLLTGFSRLAEWPMRIDGKIVKLAVSGSITCDNAELLLDMALSGLGIARFGDFMTEQELASGRLVPLLTEHHVVEPQPISALMPPGRQHLPRVRALVDFLARQSARSPDREMKPQNF